MVRSRSSTSPPALALVDVAPPLTLVGGRFAANRRHDQCRDEGVEARHALGDVRVPRRQRPDQGLGKIRPPKKPLRQRGKNKAHPLLWAVARNRLLADLSDEPLALLLQRRDEDLLFAGETLVDRAERYLCTGCNVPQPYRLVSVALRECDGRFNDALGSVIHF